MAVIEGKGRSCPLSFLLLPRFRKTPFLGHFIGKDTFFIKQNGETTESALYGNVLSSQIYKKQLGINISC
jgi:hypothetical protein